MNMYEELKAWADKWGVKYNTYKPCKRWPYLVITFDCNDNSEPVFNYNPTNGRGFWQGGE